MYKTDENYACTSPKCQQSVYSSFLQYSTERSCHICDPATLQTSVADPDPKDPYVLGLQDPHPDLLVRDTDPNPDFLLVKRQRLEGH
jgi:hypothetical protein